MMVVGLHDTGPWSPQACSPPQYEERRNAEHTDLKKTAVEREGCAVLKALYQHREAMSHPGSRAGAPLCQRNWGLFSENSETAQVRRGHSVKTNSFPDSKSYLLPQGTNTSRESLPHSPDNVCVCCRDKAQKPSHNTTYTVLAHRCWWQKSKGLVIAVLTSAIRMNNAGKVQGNCRFTNSPPAICDPFSQTGE